MKPFDIVIGRYANEYVHQCPTAKKEISSDLFMMNPKESRRHGNDDLRQFFLRNTPLNELYEKAMLHPRKLIFITEMQQIVQKIKNIVAETPIDNDRLQWLLYWITTAYSLYNIDAVVQFVE